jgi:hypothetical protein
MALELSARHDDTFGPVVTLALAGAAGAFHRPAAVALAPVSAADAEAMLGAAALIPALGDGAGALADAVVQLSRVAAANAGGFARIELDVVAGPGAAGCVATRAVVHLGATAGASVAAGRRP